MKSRMDAILPSALCSLVLVAAALVIHPIAEIGVLDDWSYIRTAEQLARTGHIVYNGWTTAVLGWQLYLGALLIRLFGFSFTVPRLGTLLIAILTTCLLQRTLLRLGLSCRNSLLATLTFALSPVFLAMTFSFMSDVYGVFVMVGCCYLCTRALLASTPTRAASWLVVADLSNAVGGSVRQIAWLGLLIMVPCTLWLLRRNRTALWMGASSLLVGLSVMLGVLHWFTRQPYALGEPLLPPNLPAPRLLLGHYLSPFAKRSVCEFLFLSLPVLLPFLPACLRKRKASTAAGLYALLVTAILVHARHTHTLCGWEFPYFFNSVWITGFNAFHAFLGDPPLLLTPAVRAVLTVLLLMGGAGLVATFTLGPRRSNSPLPLRESALLPTQSVVLLLPCAAAYMALLVTRLITTSVLDRYLLFPEFAVLTLLLLLYQRNVQRDLPRTAWFFVLVAAVLDTAGLHDTFALYRAQVALTRQLMHAGVPRAAIDAGAQFDGWTQITTAGHLNDPRIKNPAHAYTYVPRVGTDDRCQTEDLQLTPVVHARYVVSFAPLACNGPAPFPPVTFHTWYSPHLRTLYAVKGPFQ